MNIKPSDINIKNRLSCTLGKCELEVAAYHLVKFLVETGDTWSFKMPELILYYHQNKLDMNDMLFGLLGGWFDDGPMRFWDDMGYIVNWGGTYIVTEVLVNKLPRA